MSCFPPAPEGVSIVGKAGDVKILVRTSHPGDALGGEESVLRHVYAEQCLSEKPRSGQKTEGSFICYLLCANNY